MIGPFAKEYDPEYVSIAEHELASGDDLNPEFFPQLYNYGRAKCYVKPLMTSRVDTAATENFKTAIRFLLVWK